MVSALTERVDDLADGPEEVGPGVGSQLILLRPFGDREREGGGADGRQAQVPCHVLEQRRGGAQRLLVGEGGGKLKALPLLYLNFRLVTIITELQGRPGGRGLGLVDFDVGHSTTCPVVL